MAVDTRNKRAAAITIGLKAGGVFPNPDGNINNQADRQHMAFTYPGIASDAPAPFVARGMILLGAG